MIAGRYSLEREVGRGGMGTVWLAHDELLDRPVALKRIGLLPGVHGTDLARAEREAQLAARLDHPHVVAVMDVVLDPETDARWLVMEYVEGTTLARLISDGGPLAQDDAARLAWQVADALAAAHAAGIAHRDVKPSNILVDRRGDAKLTDFGIARTAADPALTQTGLVTGSPAYLAPEVWSLGATLFHMLSGRPPYDMRDNVLGGLFRIVHDEPPRLPGGGPLARLLEVTMVKDPAARWSMPAVRDHLATLVGRVDRPPVGDSEDDASTQVFEASPLSVAGGSSGSSASGRSRDRRLVVALVAAAVVAVAAVVLLVVATGREPDGDPAAGGSPDAPTSTASPSPTEKPSEPPPSSSAAPGPTAEGMESFIRSYVATVSTDPDAAWQMLTRKFQRESGGLARYRDFWSGVGPGEVLEISVDPASLAVSYRVRFQNFGTGERPTLLDLVYRDGRYLIDGERTEGFVPAD